MLRWLRQTHLQWPRIVPKSVDCSDRVPSENFFLVDLRVKMSVWCKRLETVALLQLLVLHHPGLLRGGSAHLRGHLGPRERHDHGLAVVEGLPFAWLSLTLGLLLLQSLI